MVILAIIYKLAAYKPSNAYSAYLRLQIFKTKQQGIELKQLINQIDKWVHYILSCCSIHIINSILRYDPDLIQRLGIKQSSTPRE